MTSSQRIVAGEFEIDQEYHEERVRNLLKEVQVAESVKDLILPF